MKTINTRTINIVVGIALLLISHTAFATGKYLYIQSNGVAEGSNAIIAYERQSDGSLVPHTGGPFMTGGTGIYNGTNGKLGPNDNDTPIIVSADNKRLFAVNGHSNTIAVFDIQVDGSLRHVYGSPFDSMGINPVSLSMSGDILLVANRNEDPQQLDELRGGSLSNYASFTVNSKGKLTYVSRFELEDGQKSTQILVSSRDSQIAFGNDFQVDVDFDGDGAVSTLFGSEPHVRGGLHSFMVSSNPGELEEIDHQVLPETVEPAPEVPTVPLGMWDHPQKKLLYVGLVTRNQLGVYRYDSDGVLSFVTAVPNSGQDICWLKTNKTGTRLYAVNNLPREDQQDKASTVTVFDIEGDNAINPIEIDRVELPLPLGTFTNNRNSSQPNSAAFQFDIDASESYLYVISQRINQSPENTILEGNILHTLKIGKAGKLSVVGSRHLAQDGITHSSRPQGVVSVDL